MNEARKEGYQAHANHQRRDENPYWMLALRWDRGWVQRQKEQLPPEEAIKVKEFRKWVNS